MSMRKARSAVMMIIAATVAVVAWVAWNDDNIGWAHITGLGASVLLLVLIWFWPGNWQQRKPPP
jgi:hypothetical protein